MLHNRCVNQSIKNNKSFVLKHKKQKFSEDKCIENHNLSKAYTNSDKLKPVKLVIKSVKM